MFTSHWVPLAITCTLLGLQSPPVIVWVLPRPAVGARTRLHRAEGVGGRPGRGGRASRPTCLGYQICLLRPVNCLQPRTLHSGSG